MNRHEYEDYLSVMLAGVLTKEEHQKTMEHLCSLSDEELESGIKEIQQRFPEEMTMKQMMDMQHSVLRKSNMKNTGYDNIPVTFLSAERNTELLQNISKSRPANLIQLDKKSDDAVIALWREANQNAAGIPSDLFFSGHIPLPDCKVHVDDGDGNIIKFRVVIFPDYQKLVEETDENNSVRIGAVLYEIRDGDCMILSLEVLRGHDWIITETLLGYKGIPNYARDYFHEHLNTAQVWTSIGECLSTWYGIQIALLHPLVKDIFLNPVTVIDESANKKPSKGKKGKKRPLRYIKRHIINAEELKNRIHGGSNFQRHTLVWYVMGHWRRYATGKKVFINPYWKGALRDLKNSEIREREIVLEENV